MKQAVVFFGIVLFGVLLVTSGCTKKQKTVAGAVVFAAAGAGIGSALGGTGGAVGGGIGGGLLGGLIGNASGKSRKAKCSGGKMNKRTKCSKNKRSKYAHLAETTTQSEECYK